MQKQAKGERWITHLLNDRWPRTIFTRVSKWSGMVMVLFFFALWLRKVPPPHQQPIRCKTETQSRLGHRIFPRSNCFLVITPGTYWLQWYFDVFSLAAEIANCFLWWAPTPEIKMYSSNKLFKARRQPVITRLLSVQSVMLRIITAWKANKIGRYLNKATQVLSLSKRLYFWLSPRLNRIFLTLGGFSRKKKHE